MYNTVRVISLYFKWRPVYFHSMFVLGWHYLFISSIYKYFFRAYLSFLLGDSDRRNRSISRHLCLQWRLIMLLGVVQPQICEFCSIRNRSSTVKCLAFHYCFRYCIFAGLGLQFVYKFFSYIPRKTDCQIKNYVPLQCDQLNQFVEKHIQ